MGNGEGVSPSPVGEGFARGQKNFQFWGLKRRILVHSVALLSADCTAAFCTVIYNADAIALIRYVNAPSLLFPEQFFYTIIM